MNNSTNWTPEEIRRTDEVLLGCSADEIIAQLPARISQGILHWADKIPEQVAVVAGDTSLTYKELREVVSDVKHYLIDNEVRPGDRVMLVGENSIVFVAFFLALSELNAIAAVINARLSSREIKAIRDDCTPRIVVYATSDSVDAAKHAAEDSCVSTQFTFGGVATSGVIETLPLETNDLGADQVAAMIYTTGTTGTPKGVMLTHQNLAFIAFVSGKLRGIGPADRIYCVLPMSHVFGLSAVCCSVLFGAGCADLVSRFDAKEALRALRDDEVVGFLGVPTMYALMLEQLSLKERSTEELSTEKQGAKQWHSEYLRFMYSGGAPLDPDLKNRVQATFGMPLHNGYGLTETGPTISQTRLYAPLDNCSVGFPLPGIEIKILGENGKLVPEGEVGELWVKGPNIMKGYFGKPELTAEVLIDSWFNTGDRVFEDADGSINIAGRSKELIIHSGFNIYPPEVEAVLNSHEKVAISAVVGREVPGNEEVVAFIQPVKGKVIDTSALIAYSREQLAGYKIPAEIIVVEELPAASSGKILKHLLQKQL
jgi:long-chain acyl-CoA synthetase